MFSTLTKALAMSRAKGQCECTRLTHVHGGRCTRPITSSTAHFHHKTAESRHGSDGLGNCEVLCIPCHKLTASYGRH